MKVAICTDIAEFQANRILDKSWAKKFPGAMWVSFFADLVKKAKFEVVTGDVAFSHVAAGNWKATNILVIQELDARDGRRLVELGAKPTILTGFESPLYAYNFYDQLPKLAPKFPNRVLFSGAFLTFNSKQGNNYPAYFPSYNQKDVLTPKPWNKRKFLVQVAANKYFEVPKVPFLANPKKYLNWLKDKLNALQSPTRRLAINNELISKRLEAIEYFAKLNLLDLFGSGWDKLERLPLKWQERLKKILKKLNPKPCDDKIKTISGYKFAICFENVAYPGYITEKIIDCFTAGVIPIYLGAPNISEFIPPKTFVNMRNFDSWQKLDKYLRQINQAEAQKIIAAGRNFLKSRGGLLYSFGEVANFFKKLVLKVS